MYKELQVSEAGPGIGGGDISYSLDQTPLSISHRSRIVASPPDVLNKIVAALEY